MRHLFICFILFFSCDSASDDRISQNSINTEEKTHIIDSLKYSDTTSTNVIKYSEYYIDSLIRIIDLDNTFLRKDTNCFDLSSEGAEVILFYKANNEFTKADIKIYGSIGRSLLKIYNYDSNLIYVQVKTETYDSSISSKHNKVAKMDKEILYFNKGVLNKYILNSELIVDRVEVLHRQKQILKIYEIIKTL